MSGPSRSATRLVRALASSAALSLILASLPAEAKVGVAAAVNTDAKGKPPGAAARVVTIGQTVVFNEQITTDGAGLVQILLLDGTTFTVGPNSQLLIDEFVYNPDTGDAKVVATVTKGAFRFIGGQTSRQPGGATIKTPVGTIGIRGAMVEGNVRSSSSATFSMVYGQTVTFTGASGAVSRIYRPGYSMDVEATGGNTSANVRPRSNDDAVTFQTALAGTPGRTGGAAQTPNDTTVAQSPVTQVVSNLPASVDLPPNRPASPVESSKKVEVEEGTADVTVVTTQNVVTAIEESGAPPRPGDTQTPPDNTGVTPPPPVPTRAGRVKTDPGTFFYPGETVGFANAGSRGIVGGTPLSDTVQAFAIQNGRLISSSGFDIPDLTGPQGDSGLERIDIGNAFGPTGALSGFAYAGKGDFAAYFLGAAGPSGNPAYMIFGTSTDVGALIAADQSADVRSYSLTPDPLRPSSLPFFATDLYGQPANANTTNLLAVEPGDSPNPFIKTYLSFVDISGSGADQKSAALVFADNVFQDTDGAYKTAGTRRGTFRASADGAVYNMRGGIATQAGPDGGHFFGPNADHFVIGNETADAFSDVTYAPRSGPGGSYAEDGVFGTQHVANLESETPQSTLSRTPRDVQGFMTGVGEGSQDPNGYNLGLIAAPNFFLSLTEFNYISANAILLDTRNESSQVDGIQLAFGVYSGSNGGSTFVDDNIFGAVRTNDRQFTRLITDGGDNLPQSASGSAGSYIVSGKANPIAGYQHCATVACNFIDWGWWGTRVVVDPTTTTPNPADVYVHMGTWVAGSITDSTFLPTTIVATYNGSVLGNITRASGASVARYIARGSFGLTYDFNARAGTFNLTDFDGFNLAGDVSDIVFSGQALFFGLLDGGDASGRVSGAFVNNGADIAAGVIGDVEVESATASGIGTFAGTRTSTAAADLVSARVLSEPAEFTPVGTTEVYTNVGASGVVGGTPESDRDLTLSRWDGRLRSGAFRIDLPDVTSAGETGLAALSATGTIDGTPVAGTVYAGAGDFAAYLLGIGGDQTNPYRVIVGTQTPSAVLDSLFTGTDVRTYSLTQDPLKPSVLPFFRDDLYGTPSNSNVSDFLMVESSNGPGAFDTKVMQSWIDISGSGVNQKSGALIVVGALDPNSGSPKIGMLRRGTFRYSATAGPANMRSGIDSLTNAAGESLFGNNAQNFVLSNLLDPPDGPDGMADSLLGPGFTGNPADGYLGTGRPFATTHVADLQAETPKASLSRTTRDVSGFISGMGESNIEGVNNPYALDGTINISLNAQFNSVSAQASLQDRFDTNATVQAYAMAFGVQSVGFGDSAFVDDDRFAATRNSAPSLNTLTTDTGAVIQHTNESSPGSFLVSGRANPVAGYQHCTACTFMDWGWWGTRMRFEADGSQIPSRRDDYMHMGTWVAGDITNHADLPTVGTATYAGTALGTVARATGTGDVAKYIAAGTMDMSFDFGSRTGNMTIGNFDGMTATGLISENGITGKALFDGALSGAGGVSGGVAGAFVNNGAANPAAGVIGNFGLTGPGLVAGGTIAGARVVP